RPVTNPRRGTEREQRLLVAPLSVVDEDRHGLLVRDRLEYERERPARRLARRAARELGERRRRRRRDAGSREQAAARQTERAAPGLSLIPFHRSNGDDHRPVETGASEELLGQTRLPRSRVPIDHRQGGTP